MRVLVEHMFETMNKQLGGLRICAIGQACATFRVKLPGSCYNILRSLHLIPVSSVQIVRPVVAQ